MRPHEADEFMELEDRLYSAQGKAQGLSRELNTLKEAVRNLKWESIDKDNMEFKCVATCWQLEILSGLVEK